MPERSSAKRVARARAGSRRAPPSSSRTRPIALAVATAGVASPAGASIARLGLVVELAAVGAEELDPVVVPGVVRGRDDGGEVEAVAADEDRGGRRRQHAGEQRVAARLGDPGGERRLEHRPRLARVADDQHLGPRRVDSRRRGAAERERELGGQHLAGDARGRRRCRRASSAGATTAVGRRSALRELRPLAGLLEPRLAALLLAGVAGQQPAALELAAQLRVDLA